MKVARVESASISGEKTLAFLKQLCELAVKEGADDARNIPCRELPFVRGGGKPPEGPPELRSIHWPETAYPKDDVQQALRQFQHAVVFRVDCKKASSALHKVYAIASKLESASFYAGYHLALGLAAGNCREVFCGAEEKCQALKKGSPCRYPLKARASMESCGLDLKEIVARAGWKAPGAGDDFLMGMVFTD